MSQKTSRQSGGVNIERSTVHVGGDIVARDKIVQQSAQAQDLSQLDAAFKRIYRLIEERTTDPNLDKDELRATLAKIEQELKKGDAANAQKVERWIHFIATMAEDIFQVTVATLSQPIAGVAKAIQLIAKRAKDGGG